MRLSCKGTWLLSASNCQSCHDGHDAFGKAFQHNLASFKLDGKHALTRCEACHQNQVTIAEVKATKTDCLSCHAKDDVHSGKLGPDCASCHSAAGWQQMSFDHNTRTSFMLTGKHQTAKCEGCHANLSFVGAPTDCLSCHQKDDPHQGALGTDCASCHTPDGWKPSSFDHKQSTFQLTGAHIQVECSTCHTDPKFKGTPSQCIACHQKNDVHTGALGTECTSCHTTEAWKPSTFNHTMASFQLTGAHATAACEGCHADQKYKGTPAQCGACHQKDDPHAGALGSDCSSCHTTSTWKPSTFNHDQSIFKLTGGHISVNCSSCHQDKKFKGTSTQCADCHKKNDPHSGALGSECSSCHTTSAWKPSTFNHASTSFKLTGAHQSTACQSCHADKTFQNASTDCASCHKKDDAHSGKFGTDCASCHNTSAWKPSSFNHASTNFQLTGAHQAAACLACHVDGKFKGTPTQCGTCHKKDDAHSGAFGFDCGMCHATAAWKPSTFNHATSAFPLTGSHQTVACQSCHVNNQFKGTPKDCATCHSKDDAHKGQFGTNCASCHNTSKWQDATFDHSKTAFPLTGSHSNVNCQNCHVNNVFKGTPKDCVSCHSGDDAHKGQFGTDCASCHNTSKWQDATFDHSKTAFPLTGSHNNVNCQSCHVNNVFKGTPKDCVSCHSGDDAHKGQFGTNCASCHNTSKWQDATFDHSQTAFPLTGSHNGVACQNCHVNNVFKGTPQDCASCHSNDDAHQGRFGTDCASCHNTSNWQDATFDHSKSGFPLTGAHVNVNCQNCHVNNVFQGTPSACSSCHQEPAIHSGLFGTDCSSCHTTSAWTPASFNGQHTFPINHGGAKTCQSCHQGSFSTYTCYTCHDQSRIQELHKDRGDFSNCVRCHANGRED